MSDRTVLFEAYRRTSFTVNTSEGSCHIRVGQPSACLDALLASHGATTWAYITAWNPGSIRQSPEQNGRQNAALASELFARGLACYSGQGIPNDPSWTPEDSYLVIDIPEADAIDVGHPVWASGNRCRQQGDLAATGRVLRHLSARNVSLTKIYYARD